MRGLLTRWRPHAYKAAAITKTMTSVCLIGRRFMVVESEIRLTGWRIDADGIANKLLALTTVAEFRTFRLVFAIKLCKQNTLKSICLSIIVHLTKNKTACHKCKRLLLLFKMFTYIYICIYIYIYISSARARARVCACN